MAKKWIFLILILTFTFSSFNFAYSQSEKVEIHFFYSVICPHCEKEKEFLGTLKDKYPQLDIKEYEVIGSKENQQILGQFYESYEVPKVEWGLIPVTFTESKYFIGFSEQIGAEIESCIEECIGIGGDASQKIRIPVIGEIDISKMSLPALAAALGFLDGFNPCAMWVLLFLITLLMNARSKKRMYLIGGTFILASGIVYYLILTAWLNLFLVISYVNLTRILIGVLAIALGFWQIKNFIQYEPGTCKVTDGKAGFQDRIKSGLKTRAEKLVLSPLNLGIIGGIIILALGVNLVEFFCSAGLPAIFTRVLTLNKIPTLSYYLYLLLYTFIFMLDDLIIFSLAIFALSKIGFTERYNYWATLIGGIIILILGLSLIFKPELLIFA
jgi:thiol-disulfide isomerase/thioredoxin